MALRNQPYIPLYVQDFLTDEKLIECSAETTGVYIRLMCIMHKSNEYGTILLKQKDKQNTGVALNFAEKLSKQMPFTTKVILKGLNELLEEKVLEINGDYLTQHRMVKDNDISIKRSEAGKKGGFATAKSPAKVIANSESEYEDVIEDIDKIDFSFFYELYPIKKSKALAERKWKSLSHTNQSKCIDVLKSTEYKNWLAEQDIKFVKHPSTWLNQGCWDDELNSKKSRLSKSTYMMEV
jgi:hypothetical protein